MEPTCKGQLAGECAVADADQEEATWDPVEIPTCSDITETLEQVTHQENCEISEGGKGQKVPGPGDDRSNALEYVLDAGQCPSVCIPPPIWSSRSWEHLGLSHLPVTKCSRPPECRSDPVMCEACLGLVCPIPL